MFKNISVENNDIIFKDKRIKTDDGYHISNIMFNNNILNVEYSYKYDKVLKVYKYENNNLIYLYSDKIITCINKEWINNGELIIPSCDSILNLNIDGNMFDKFNILDLRNVKVVDNIILSNCYDLNTIVLSDPLVEIINLNIDVDNLKLNIVSSNIINSFGNKVISLEFKSSSGKKFISINSKDNEYIIKYGNNNHLIIKDDLKIYEYDNNEYKLISPSTFNLINNLKVLKKNNFNQYRSIL